MLYLAICGRSVAFLWLFVCAAAHEHFKLQADSLRVLILANRSHTHPYYNNKFKANQPPVQASKIGISLINVAQGKDLVREGEKDSSLLTKLLQSTLSP